MGRVTVRGWSGASVVLLLLLGIGCASGGARNVARGRGARAAARGGGVDLRLSEGYGLLYDLLVSVGKADGVLLVKGASDGTVVLLREIAQVSREGAQAVRGFAEQDEQVRADWTGLREVERLVRKRISGATGRELLFAGEDFEVRLLLTQSEATRYGTSICYVLSGLDGDEARSAWLDGYAKKYGALHQRVVQRLRTVEQ